MKQFLFVVTSLLILSSTTYGQSKWWVSSDSVNIFTRNTGGVMIGGVEPLGKLTVGGDRLGFNLALVGDYNNLTKNYLKIGVLGRASNGLDGHTLFDLYHSNGTLKKAGFNFRINEKSAFFINGEGNIGIGTEKPMAGLDITSGPDWGGFKKGLRLSANNAISVESGEMKYGMVGSENALHFFATNGGEKVNPFGSAFAKLMSLQPKKVVIEGDLEVKGKIIYDGGQFQGGGTNTGSSNTGGSSAGSVNSDDGGKIETGGSTSNGMITEGTVYEEDVINGYGDNGFISKFIGTYQIRNSTIFENASGFIGIGSTSPGAKLEINGGPALTTNYFKSIKLNNKNAIEFIANTTRYGWSGNADGKIHLFYTDIDEGGEFTASIMQVGTGEIRNNATTVFKQKVKIENGNTACLLNAGLNLYSQGFTSNNSFRTNIASSGFNIQTNNINNVFTPGIFWSTTNDNTTKPKVGIYSKFGPGGSHMYFGTSNSYATGITNTAMVIDSAGNVGIGTTNPGTYRLAVNGDMKVKKVVVTQNAWADFVFADDYKLMPLNQLEKHVKTHKHLPGIPTEKEVMKSGVDIGEVQAKLLQKVEELTLYMIEMNKKIEKQDKKILEQEQELNKLQSIK